MNIQLNIGTKFLEIINPFYTEYISINAIVTIRPEESGLLITFNNEIEKLFISYSPVSHHTVNVVDMIDGIKPTSNAHIIQLVMSKLNV